MYMSQFRPIVAAFAAVLLVAGCQTAPKTADARANLIDQADVALRRFERSDDSIRTVLDHAAGYAVFPDVGKGGFIAGGAYGKGVVYQGRDIVGFADMSEATVGFQAGGQEFSELIIFQNEDALNRFRDRGGYGLAAEASAVALKPGAAAQAEYKRGVMVFALTNSGLMAEAAVAGQKFRFTPATDADRNADRMDERDRRDVGTAGERQPADRYERHNNVSGSSSFSTPNGGDRGAAGAAKVGASGSVSTPSGDRSVTTETEVKTTERERDR
jgi:lipid-binding SYLF domain-containing protein